MSNRKDKIKNIAIIFLVIMLILTFFSNTIMNYSLVEVSTQAIMSDTITSKVRGSGTVEASENYAVSISESRKIATVNVKTGAEVTQGDVLLTLEDMESEELVAARKSLTDAEYAYELAVLESGMTVAQRQAIEAGKGTSLSDKQNQIATAQANVDAAQATVDSLQAKVDTLENVSVDTSAEELAVLNANRTLSPATETKTEKNEAYETASATYSAAKSAYDDAEAAYDDAVAEYNIASAAYESNTDASKEAALKKAVDDAYAAMTDAKTKMTTAETNKNAAYNALTTASGELSSATNTYNTAKKAYDDAEYALAVKKLSASSTAESSQLQQQLATAQATLTAAQDELTSVTGRVKSEISIASQYATLVDLRAEVAELEANAVGAEITAPINGTVTEILYTAGQTVDAEETILTIQPENKAFTLKFNVTANQAKRIKPGDPAEILNNWWGNEISAEVLSIRKDPNDRNTSTVICEISGDVSVGDNYTLSIGEQSANYDLVVPTSSIREDSNGNFILIIESKSTPLGNRYYARRVDVEVVTSDDTNSAITGALEGYEYVITTTTKPVEENQQVRLAD